MLNYLDDIEGTLDRALDRDLGPVHILVQGLDHDQDHVHHVEIDVVWFFTPFLVKKLLVRCIFILLVKVVVNIAASTATLW